MCPAVFSPQPLSSVVVLGGGGESLGRDPGMWSVSLLGWIVEIRASFKGSLTAEAREGAASSPAFPHFLEPHLPSPARGFCGG